MSNLLKRKNVLNVKKYLRQMDQNIDLIVLDKTARTAKDAAKSLNKEVGSIVKSLLIKNEELKEYYLCLVSGDKYMSLEKLSNIIGYEITKANAEECKKISGFSIGAVSPFAHIHPPSRIFIDENLNKYNLVYAAAGHPFVVFGITYKNLCELTKGEVISIVQ